MAAGGGRGTKAITSRTPSSTKTTRKPTKPRTQQLTKQLINTLSSAIDAAHSFLLENDLRLLPSQLLSLESLIPSLSLALSSFLSPSPLPPPVPTSSSLSYTFWFQRFTASANFDHDPRWVHCFRMSRPSFSTLLSALIPFLFSSLPTISPNTALAAFLFRLAHGASYKSLARHFGFESSAEACRVFYTVCKLINDKLGYLFELRSDINRVVVGFGWNSLPNCCGFLGLERFRVDGELLGENGSILVQALVDSEGRFLDVSAGWPGNMKPETILRQTKLFSGVEESRELLNGPSYRISDGNMIPQYVLGDSCFPLLPWLITPYIGSNEEEDRFGSAQREFNTVHGRVKGLVDTAFDRVRGRWQLVAKRWKEESLETFPFMIVTACLMHNFLIKCDETMADDVVECSKMDELPAFEGGLSESGLRVRYALAKHLIRVSLRR